MDIDSLVVYNVSLDTFEVCGVDNFEVSDIVDEGCKVWGVDIYF